MTRREWLKLNPPPKEARALIELWSNLKKKTPATAETTARIASLEKEIAACAKCSQHGEYLVRHKNRQEDLFVCPTGPHFFLWSKAGAIPALCILDVTKPMPELDKPMPEAWI